MFLYINKKNDLFSYNKTHIIENQSNFYNNFLI